MGDLPAASGHRASTCETFSRLSFRVECYACTAPHHLIREVMNPPPPPSPSHVDHLPCFCLLQARSIRVWDTEEQCACVLPPPPPSPPPAGIYFCGKPAVWHFFDYTINPHTCYVSFDISRLEVMSLGVDVSRAPPPLPLLTPPP